MAKQVTKPLPAGQVVHFKVKHEFLYNGRRYVPGDEFEPLGIDPRRDQQIINTLCRVEPDFIRRAAVQQPSEEEV
jgi:hypothetical protein